PTLLFVVISLMHFVFFFFQYTSTTDIYTLSLHDALPIYIGQHFLKPRALEVGARISVILINFVVGNAVLFCVSGQYLDLRRDLRSEEHTSELQSRFDLVCRLLLEKKKFRNISFSLLVFCI